MNWYERYYSGEQYVTPSPNVEDFTDSDSMYDANVGITHFILKDDNGNCRIVSDAEMVMTPDPSVTCHFSPEYLANLKNAILSKPHNSLSNVDRDDNPVGGVVVPDGLERDELSNVIESRTSTLFSQLGQAMASAHEERPQPESPSSDEKS